MQRLDPRAIGTAGASDGDGLFYDAATDTVMFAPVDGGTLIADGALPAAADHPNELAVLTSVSGTDPELGADGVHPSQAGMDYLAIVYEDALTNAGKAPAPGSSLYAYGDSWTATDTYNAAGQKAIDQLAAHFGLALTNRAVGGSKMYDVSRQVVSGAPFVAGSTGMGFIAAGLNDLKDTDTPRVRAGVANHLRAALATMSAAERIEDGAFTYSAGWTSTSFSPSSGGTNRRTTTNGATASYTITTPGDYYLLTFGADGITSVGGILTVTQGGTTLATIDLNQASTPGDVGPAAVRLAGVLAGTLTITFSTGGRSGAQGWVDALLRISPTPPTILAVKPVRVIASNYQNDALLAFIRDQYDAMGAEFGSHVVVADPAPNGGVPELWFSDGSSWAQPTAASSGTGTTPAAADVAFTPAGGLAATDVQDALVELDSEKVSTSEKGAAGGLATLGSDGKVPATQLPSGTAGTAAGTSFAPTAGIASTNVQAAVEELAIETVPTAAVGIPNGVASLGADGKVPSSQLPASSGGSSTGKDPRWTIQSGQTSADEFNDATLDAAWVRADGTGAAAANVTWTEAADVLSCYNNGGDSASVVHGLVRPVGGAVAPGDAFVTCMSMLAPAANYSMAGIVLTDSAAHGAGVQVLAMPFSTSGGLPVELWPGTGWTAGAAAMNQTFVSALANPNRARLYLRLVCTAANTWRIDISPDGVSWLKGTAAARTLTPTHVGLLSSSWGSANKSVAAYEFLRRVAGVS